MEYILRTKEEKYDDLISDEYMKGSYAVYGKMFTVKLYVIPVHPYTWLNKASKYSGIAKIQRCTGNV